MAYRVRGKGGRSEKSIKVSEDVWVQLAMLKIELRARAMDDVLRLLLDAYKRQRGDQEGGTERAREPEKPPDGGNLPSFVADNPWLAIISARARG